MLRFSSLILALSVSLLVSLQLRADEIATYGKSLKDEYTVEGESFSAFYRTNKIGDSFGLICSAGHALPSLDRDGWYTYKAIDGLMFELRAELAVEANEKTIPMGFAVFTKENQVIKVLKPNGEYEGSTWDGNAFISWSERDSEVRIRSVDGEEGYAYIDLHNGDGLFYKKRSHDAPEYFLKDCQKIKEEDLPLYDWR